MDAQERLTEFLQTTGWPGLVAILLVSVLVLVRYIRDQHRERIEEQRSTIKLVEGVRGFLSSSEKALDRNTDRVDRLCEKFDQFTAEWRAG